MPRKPREEVAGGVFHVTARGNNRRAILADEADLRTYLRFTGEVVVAQGWLCLAYCLMHNHAHLLVETPEPNLGHGMQRLQGDYARHHNDQRGESGHVFQGRYGAERLKRDAHLWSAVGYIARNPVEAGLCVRPEDWPWSSHAALAAGSPPPWLAHHRLLAYLGANGGDPVYRYAECVDSASRPLLPPADR